MFGRLHGSLKTPVNAMALQAGITIIFVSMGEGFRSLINFAVVVSWMAYFLTVCSTHLHRAKLTAYLATRFWVWSFCELRNLNWQGKLNAFYA
jgi:amino acid transporter